MEGGHTKQWGHKPEENRERTFRDAFRNPPGLLPAAFRDAVALPTSKCEAFEEIPRHDLIVVTAL